MKKFTPREVLDIGTMILMDMDERGTDRDTLYIVKTAFTQLFYELVVRQGEPDENA